MEKFIEKFAAQFDNTDAKIFNESTRFKETVEWCSMTALFIISMADEEYNVTLKREDILNANTIGDIYYIIQKRK